MGDLDGKVALITGAGQGVGRGIALELARAGASVAVAGRTLEKVEEVAREIDALGGQAQAVSCDVVDGADIERTVDETVARFGTVDILVNNAQGVPLGRLLEVDDEMFRYGFESGPMAALRFMRACHPHLCGGGSIVNLGSGSALRPDPIGYGAYAAVKEAIRTLTRAAACEWGPDGIRVNAIVPLAMSPGMEAWSKLFADEYETLLASVPLGRIGDCEQDIGRAVAMLVGPGSGYVTGQTLMLDGGQSYLR